MTKSGRHLMLAVLGVLASLRAAQGSVAAVGAASLGDSLKGLGVCPTYSTVSNLDRSAFGGEWFVYQQSDNSIENLWACKKIIYSPTDDKFEYKFRVNNIDTSYVGSYTFNAAGPGVASVNLKYQLALGADSFGNVNQFVAATDNDDFAILRACTNFGLFNQQYVHVLTRAREPSPAVIASINNALAAGNIQLSQVALTNYAGCP